MIFNTLSEDFRYRNPKKDYIEIKIKIPRDILEKAIQDAFSPEF
jgi:hypothetical protein